ncbi:MAG: WecB/TagA/CpsF family glycosyltransferase [Akkermansiaceae bacterium]|nr:WecB/TagA/CpsF family glycosyltransferase [Verrucomicrobiales bacterium]
MQTIATRHPNPRDYRQILGVQFFIGNAPQAVEMGARGGLMVAPAAPALVDLKRDHAYREALLESDLVITDSGFLVLTWNAMMMDGIQRVSGLEYLRLLLRRPEFSEPDAALWVMPSERSLIRNLGWLRAQGYPVERGNCYIAPHYPAGRITDAALVELINDRRPAHVIIAVGGGVQEKLGLHLKRQCYFQPAIHCIGAAIGFLTGDQVRIPPWADQWTLGWLFRCTAHPSRFVPRYAKAVRLAHMVWKHRAQMPS